MTQTQTNGKTSGKTNGKKQTLHLSSEVTSQTTRLAAAWEDLTAKHAEVKTILRGFAPVTADGYLPKCLDAIESARYTVETKVTDSGKVRITVHMTLPKESPSLLPAILRYDGKYESEDLLTMGGNAFTALHMITILRKRNDAEEVIKGITGKGTDESFAAALDYGDSVLRNGHTDTFRSILAVITACQKAYRDRVNAIKAREVNAPGTQPNPAREAKEAKEESIKTVTSSPAKPRTRRNGAKPNPAELGADSQTPEQVIAREVAAALK